MRFTTYLITNRLLMELKNEFLQGLGKEYEYRKIKYKHDLMYFLKVEAKNTLLKKIKEILSKKPNSGIKFHVGVQIELKKITKGNTTKAYPWFLSSVNSVYYLSKDISKIIRKVLGEILDKFEAYLQLGSGFVFHKVLALGLNIAEFIPLRGGFTHFSQLPKELKCKRACISFSCNDGMNDCFIYAVLGFLYPKKINRSRKGSYKQLISTLDCSNLSYPTKILEIPTFEKRNGLCITVYSWRNKMPVVIYHSKNKVGADRCIDLLLIKEHFHLITNLSRLIGSSFSKEHCKKYVCRSCLSSYRSKQKLDHHKVFCIGDGYLFQMPEEDENVLEFKNYRYQIPLDFTIYYDFESLLKRDKNDVKVHQTHLPIACGAKRICYTNPKYNSELFIHVGFDCVEKFIQFLLKQMEEIFNIHLLEYYPIYMTEKDKQYFKRQDFCEFCRTKFGRYVKKVRDHSHLNRNRVEGNFRYALCEFCNLTYAARNYTVNVIAHSSMRYDTHFLVTALAKTAKKEKLFFKILPKNSEQNLQINFGNFIFKDSYAFLPSSLAKIIEGMEKIPKNFPTLYEFAKSDEKFRKLCRKGVFAYSFLDDEKKLSMKGLPSKDCFFDELSNKHITYKEFLYAKMIYETFECKNFQDYMVLYLCTDVCLLIDSFEQFRKMILECFKLDPLHFISTPHLSLHAMLKMTNVQIELFKSYDMYSFVHQACRGGVSFIGTRYAEAYNESLSDYVDKSENNKTSHILYFDCTNLYAFGLNSCLPLNSFEWLNKKAVESFDLMAIPQNSDFGFFLEVDLEYPNHLHDQHNDLPLAPEKKIVTSDMLSPYTKDIASKFKIKIESGKEKLLTHLGDRQNYVVHYKCLQYYVKLGMKITKIHRILKFRQSRWIQPFIEYVTEKRKNSKSEFESLFWKTVNNALYGKLLQNPLKNINLRLVNTRKRFLQLTGKPTFKKLIIYNKSLAGIELRHEKILLNKPVAVAFSVLDLSKLHIYKFHYNFIQQMFPLEKQTLLFTDTDSLCYHIHCETKYLFDIIKANRKYFDLSNFPSESELYHPKNKKRIGTMKLEYLIDNKPNENTIAKFVGLRSKMYALLISSNMTVKRAKGLKEVILKNIHFEKYLSALLGDDPEIHKFKTIRSKKHIIRTENDRKIGLSCFDDKRYVQQHGICTLAHHHYKISK